MSIRSVQYSVNPKSYCDRLISAACIYWDMEPEYFFKESDDEMCVYRRGLLCYILNRDAFFGYETISSFFHFRRLSTCSYYVSLIEDQMPFTQSVSKDIYHLVHLTDRLNVSIISVPIIYISPDEIDIYTYDK